MNRFENAAAFGASLGKAAGFASTKQASVGAGAIAGGLTGAGLLGLHALLTKSTIPLMLHHINNSSNNHLTGLLTLPTHSRAGNRLVNNTITGGLAGAGAGALGGYIYDKYNKSKRRKKDEASAENTKQAMDDVTSKVLRSGALGAALGGGGTALYDYLAGTPKGRLRRALMGAGLGGVGGAGVGLMQSYADQKAKELETADAASKSSPAARAADKQNKDVAEHGIYSTRRKATDRGEGRQTKQQKKDVASHGIYQTQRKSKEEVAKSTLEGARLGVDQLKNMVGTLPGAAGVITDSAKDVVAGGVVNPLRDLFKRKMQEAEAARIAKNRDALLSNVQAINSMPKSTPSTAIPDNLIIPPANLYGKYDSKNQADWDKYNKGMSEYRNMLRSQPVAPTVPSLGAPTSAADIEAMRRAIQSGGPK